MNLLDGWKTTPGRGGTEVGLGPFVGHAPPSVDLNRTGIEKSSRF